MRITFYKYHNFIEASLSCTYKKIGVICQMEHVVDGFLCIFMDAKAIFSLEKLYY